MFLRFLPELVREVIERALGEQVHHFGARLLHPVHRHIAVNKREHFNPVDQSVCFCPFGNRLYRCQFAFRHACRGDLYPVHFYFCEQQPRDG